MPIAPPKVLSADKLPPQESADCLAETNRLNAETIKLVAEANEARARQLLELEQAAQRLQRELTAEAARLTQLDQELRVRQARIEEAEAPPKGSAASAPRGGLASQEERPALTGALAKRLETEQLLKQEQARNEAAARAQILVANQEIERLKAESARLVTQFWPAGLRGEPWLEWRERLLGRAATEGPAALLLARLYVAAALEKAGRPLILELLRDIGRSVYEVAAPEAERIAQALNQSAAGRFEIKVIRPGDRVDNKFMKLTASGVVEVRAVSGWAVRDANGQWQFPADVG